VAWLTGCASYSCPGGNDLGIVVTVIDAKSGQRICDASVQVQSFEDGGQTVQLIPSETTGSMCVYTEVGIPPTTFSDGTVTRAGYTITGFPITGAATHPAGCGEPLLESLTIKISRN